MMFSENEFSNSTLPRRVIVINDSEDSIDLMRAFFQPKKYTVSSFRRAELDLTKIEPLSGVVLADPRILQHQDAESVRILSQTLPIILVVEPETDEKAITDFSYTVFETLRKPISFLEILASVERAQQTHSLTPHIENGVSEQTKVVEMTSNNPIVGNSPKFLLALEVAKRVARSSANIFIFGESGTGKEVIARFIHSESSRKDGPFIAINSSAIPENLLESELFGHAKGSFTGAHEKKIGLFEEAEGGTLFLDEIGDLSAPLQAKLLRVLQEKKIQRVGENVLRPFNARVISATHKNLSREIQDGRFREDLFYRLNVIPVALPPLRERRDDILPLAEAFLRKFAAINDSPARVFSEDAIKFMLEYSWRGNVRELENAVERAVVMATKPKIDHSDFLISNPDLTLEVVENHAPATKDSDFVVHYDGHLLPLQDVVQKYVEYAVAKNGGAKCKTARVLGIDRKTLHKRMPPADVYAN
jgi:two-component system, NtrC family, response regulator HydG